MALSSILGLLRQCDLGHRSESPPVPRCRPERRQVLRRGFQMFKPTFTVLGPVKYVLPLAALVAIAFGISLAIGKRAPEQGEISKASALLSPVSSPATARVENAETTIFWAGETGEPGEKADPGPRTNGIKPGNAVSTSTAPQYEVAPGPVEAAAHAVKEPKPRKVVEETKLPRRSSQANRRVGEQYGTAPASSHDPHAINGFKAPSGNIHCQLQELENGGKPTTYLRCDILDIQGPLPPKPRNCDGKWGQAFSVLQDAHRAQRMCYTDAVMNDRMQALPYSSTWRRAGFSCISEPSGVTCTNRSGRGFRLSRASQKLF